MTCGMLTVMRELAVIYWGGLCCNKPLILGEMFTGFSLLPAHFLVDRQTHAGLSNHFQPRCWFHQLLWCLFCTYCGSRWCLLTSYKTRGNVVTERAHGHHSSRQQCCLCKGRIIASGRQKSLVLSVSKCIIISLLLWFCKGITVAHPIISVFISILILSVKFWYSSLSNSGMQRQIGVL